MSYIPILSYSYIINNKNTLCRFAAHERGCLSAIVLYPCTAVGRAGISHIKDTIRMALDKSRLARLSHQQTKYPPDFSTARKGRVWVYLFSRLLILYHYTMRTLVISGTQCRRYAPEMLFYPITPPLTSATPRRGTKGGYVLRCISYMSYSTIATASNTFALTHLDNPHKTRRWYSGVSWIYPPPIRLIRLFSLSILYYL